MTAMTPFGRRRPKLIAPFPSGVGMTKVSVETPLTVSANILKLAAPRGMSRSRARLDGLPVSRHSAARNSSSRVDAVSDLGENVGALGDGHPAPRARKRSLGGAAGRVDFRPAALRHAADHAVVDGRAVLPAPAGRALGEDAVDEVGGVAARALEAYGRLSECLNRHPLTPAFVPATAASLRAAAPMLSLARWRGKWRASCARSSSDS